MLKPGSRKLLQHLSLTFFANLVAIGVSALIVLIVPKAVPERQFALFQLFLFYTTYAGFFHLGWNDGIYLRYGGWHYRDLDKPRFFSQFHALTWFQLIVAMLLIGLSGLLSHDADRLFVLAASALFMVVLNVRYFLIFVLQATNRLRENAWITILDRAVTIALVMGLLAFGSRDFRTLILADLAGRSISLIYALWCCRDIVFRRARDFRFDWGETRENISAGSKLMFSTLAGLLIIGFVRLGIERTWDLATFGRVSLSLSISNLLMQFINAVGVILFPILKRLRQEVLPKVYTELRTILMVGLFGFLLLYWPIQSLVRIWLPNYRDSLHYMALLFPMSLYEGEMALLNSTYLKALREERALLRINLLTLLFSVVLTVISTFWLRQLNLAILSIVALLALRCRLAENLVLQRLRLPRQLHRTLAETVYVVLFVLLAWRIRHLVGILPHLGAFALWLIYNGKQIRQDLKSMKSMLSE